MTHSVRRLTSAGLSDLPCPGGGITSVEAFAGYLQQNYNNSAAFPTISVPTFGLTGYWNPIRELWVKPFVRRTVDDSALTQSVAYINTSAGLDVNYHMRPNVRYDFGEEP